jgi:1-acyl-sn-glycerol-3-phosphate acyltransferase
MRTILLFIIYVILILFLIPILLFCAVLKTSEPLFVIARWAMHLGQRILGLRVQLSGLEQRHGEKTYIFMPNHESFLDGPLMFMLIPQKVRVILKKEIYRVPVLGQAMRCAEFVSVDRQGKEGGKKSIKKAVLLIKEKKYSFLIFPEGTRSLDGRLQEFRRGGFFLAQESRTDIVPVSISGTFELMPKGRFFVKKGTISVIFHPPVSLQGRTFDDMTSLIEEVKRIVLSGLVPKGACEC